MEELKEVFGGCWSWLKDNSNSVIAIATVVTALTATVALFINRIRTSPPPPGGEVRLSVKNFQAVLEEREQQVTQRLAQAHGDERRLLEDQLTEVKRQLSDIETAHADALKQIVELEAVVVRLGDDINDKQLAEIRRAIETGDFSKADALLAEIEDRTDVAVVRAAEVAFQRGIISAIQIKWGEAATHFDKAARLNPTYDHLNQAGLFAGRAARHQTALRHFDELLKLSRREYNERSPRTAIVLNNLASVLQATGRYAEAESLCRQALEIRRKVLGEGHPDYATGLNNLAGVLQATGQYAEAEPLYRQALEIDRKVLAEGHPDYAAGLSNLASVLEKTGQYAEAEPLYQQAVEIVRASLGEEHPNTKRLAGNYVQLLRAQFPDHPALAELDVMLGENANNN